MGYSIGIRPRNKQAKAKMLAFMGANYRLPTVVFHKLFPTLTGNYSRFTDDMSYDHGKWALGFDYNACEPERDYIFAVTRWMALKIGREKTFRIKEIGTITELPYYVYDGYESCPLLIDSIWKNKIPLGQRWRLVNKIGFRAWDNQWYGVPRLIKKDGKLNWKIILQEKVKNATALLDGVSPYTCYNIIHKELRRLDRLWEKNVTISIV